MNKRLAANATYRETKTGYEYRTDDRGRVVRAHGQLVDGLGERNSYQQRVAGRPNRLSTDDGGHFFATVFRGPGEAINLAPMDANLNRGAWKSMENSWRDALRAGKQVSVAIDVKYGDEGNRPSRFTVEYQIEGADRMRRMFKNRPGGA